MITLNEKEDREDSSDYSYIKKKKIIEILIISYHETGNLEKWYFYVYTLINKL